MKKEGWLSKYAAKEFMIVEKKRPIEEVKLSIKNCLNAQLKKHNFKKFRAKYWGTGILFKFLLEVYETM